VCKHFRMKPACTFWHEPIIHASVDARNAYEINAFRHTISSQTQRRIDGNMGMDESNVRKMLYSIANTATITVPPVCERGVTRSLHNGKLCIVLDGELPIP